MIFIAYILFDALLTILYKYNVGRYPNSIELLTLALLVIAEMFYWEIRRK